jgi:hypothetical protein
MRFDEITYFHGSTRQYHSQQVVTGQRTPHLEAEERVVENILEQCRPQNCMPRERCVYMVGGDEPDPADAVERAGGFSTYMYRVAPQGPVERNDVFWWGELCSWAYEYMDGDKERAIAEMKPIAEKYWAGEASHRPLWEYRSKSFVVIEQL